MSAAKSLITALVLFSSLWYRSMEWKAIPCLQSKVRPSKVFSVVIVCAQVWMDVCVSIIFQMFTHANTNTDRQSTCNENSVPYRSFVLSTVECVKHGYLLTHTVFARILNILSVFMNFQIFCCSVFVVIL